MKNYNRIIFDLFERELSLIPEQFLNEEICLRSIKYDWVSFRHVPEQFLSEKFIHKALLINEEVFKFIPELLITTKMVNYVIKKNKSLFFNIPKKLLTKDLCMMVIKHNPRDYVKDIPIEFIPYLIEECIKEDPRSIVFFPKKCITKQIMDLAVSALSEIENKIK